MIVSIRFTVTSMLEEQEKNRKNNDKSRLEKNKIEKLECHQETQRITLFSRKEKKIEERERERKGGEF